MNRYELINEIRSVLKSAEGRGLTAEEREKIAKLEADVSSLDDKAKIEARASKLITSGAEIVDQILTNNVTKSENSYNVRREMGKVLKGILTGEIRTLAGMTEGTAANGGNAVQSQLLAEIINKKRDLNPIWSLARVIPMRSSSMKVPVQGTQTLALVEGEGDAVGDGGTQPTINQITLTAQKIAHLITLSSEVIDDSEVDMQEYIIGILAEAVAAKEEALMIAGTGGLAVATSVSSVAISTETLGTSSVSAADLFEIFHGINRQYRQNATWFMNDSTAKAIRQLTNSVSGDYIWQPGLQAGQPDMLLGRPVHVSSSMPALATGARAIVFGDMSRFLIGQRKSLEFKRLEELYAANDLVGLMVSERLAFALGHAEAFKVGVCA